MKSITSFTAKRAIAATILAGAVLFSAACNDDDDDSTGPSSTRTYRQIERLGNPLVSEVFFPKRDHGLDNTKSPSDDPLTMDAGGTDVPGHIRSFVSQFPGRTEKTITTLQAVLSPDMLLVYPNRAGSTAGWLSWALQPGVGYGGRKLVDDVVDTGLASVFGNALDPAQAVLAGLTTDNVGPSTRTFSTTFPYLGTPR
ncbi:MAG TPA: DUF4331 family protein [Gemmatimonadaceae bacterium]|nr:DUF4331 family protein [Gemmatimonadaceae bacterium]